MGTPPAFPLPEIGETVNARYVIKHRIGRGGFGVVFQARDRVLEKPVALKFLNPQLTADEKKFHRVRREINNAQLIADPRIVKIFSLEEYQGTAAQAYFLVMELIQGESLKKKIQSRGKLSWAFFRPIFFEILEGVAALHRRGIIHRDLKPSNIMITEQGNVKILDFGLSKGQADLELTSSINELVGSPYFMSPEQIQGTGVGKQSDLYQATLILYQALSGSLPYSTDTSTMEMMLEKLQREPRNIKSHGVHLARFLEFGILRGLERRPRDRFPDIHSMIDYFRTGRPPRLPRIRRALRRRKIRSVVLLTLGIVTTFLAVAYIRDKDKVVDLSSRGGRIQALNRFGLTIWEKDFSPFSISRIIHMPTQNDITAKNKNPRITKPFFALFLSNPKINTFDPGFSIATDKADNRLIFMNARGEKRFDQSYTQAFLDRSTYGFSRRFHIVSIEANDLDKDGSPEHLLRIYHAPSMYPSAFVKIDDRIASFVNPGTITAYWPLGKDPSRNTFLLYGRNNLLSHFEFVAEINMEWDRYSIPNLNNDHRYNIHGFMALAPEGKVVRNEWESHGRITIQDTRNQDMVTVHRDHHLSIQREDRILQFRDDPQNIHHVYGLINQAFNHKLVQNRPNLAHQYITKALGMGIQNPYLLSCLFFLKGDLEILVGEYRKARASLRKALAFYSYNTDARQRICDSYFLAGDLDKTHQTLDKARLRGNWFWGISLGLEIYRFYCHLQEGDFVKARDFFETLTNLDRVPRQVTNRVMESVFLIYQGEYKTALSRLESIQGKSLEVFTIEEYRLMLGRALLLKKLFSEGLEPQRKKRMDFYFSDIFHNSLGHKTLAAVSHFLLRSEGSPEKPDSNPWREKLDQAFEKRIFESRGNFISRVWLFFDAYVYGRAMENLGLTKKAARGYRVCIEANPHTALAADARARLKCLSSPPRL